jgi:hypothetical protein
MALHLSELPDHPGQIAATKIGVFIPEGVFFLDFSRPLEPIWKPGLLIRWFHSPIGGLVPVVHQGERTGEYVIGIHRGDPCYAQLHALWKKRYPYRKKCTLARSIRTQNYCGLREAIPRGQSGMPSRMAFIHYKAA